MVLCATYELRHTRDRPPRAARAGVGAGHRAGRAARVARRRRRVRGRGGRADARRRPRRRRRGRRRRGADRLPRGASSRVEWRLDDDPGGTRFTVDRAPARRRRPRRGARSSPRWRPPPRCARRETSAPSSPRSPTRRAARSCARSPSGPGLTASHLAGELPMTRQAVAKHLSALSGAGLVHGAPRGPRDALHAHARPRSARRSTWMTAVGARVGRATAGERAGVERVWPARGGRRPARAPRRR